MKNIFTLFIIFFSSIICLGQKKIKIDQFGYQPFAKKVAVISRPVIGYNGGSTFTPGLTPNAYQVKNASTNAVVFSGTPTAWNSGMVDSISGDIVWWFDFSAFTTPGSYYIKDNVTNETSYVFSIDSNVNNGILKTALHMYYYQRCGVPKIATYAGANHSDATCHIGGTNQDKNCRLYSSPNDATTNKDLSGGWHDAGDYNKYVTFTFEALNHLLLAYKEKPDVWSDNSNVPESGNGIPDIVDEIKFELDWLLKMQQANGSVLSVVGTANFGTASPPSADANQRLYGPATTGATFTAACVFAQASHILKSIPSLSSYCTTLQTAAINAYSWGVANPSVTFYNGGVIAAGENEQSAYEVTARKFDAAVYLYACTGSATYKTYVDANYGNIHPQTWYYWYQFEMAHADALLYYAKLTGANLPTASVAADIINSYTTSISGNNGQSLPAYTNNKGSYRMFMNSYDYSWNSHNFIANNALIMYNAITYNINPANHVSYKNAALGHLNYYHGVNPQALTYLTDVTNIGADNCITEIYHGWFKDGSAWDKTGVSLYGPAKGFLTGGVNPQYHLDNCCAANSCGAAQSMCVTANYTPPIGQPALKSYKDYNTDWPVNSFEITEVGIYTQAAYLRLLSKFSTDPTTIPLAIANIQLNGKVQNSQVQLTWPLLPKEKYTSIELQKKCNNQNFVTVLDIKNNQTAFTDLFFFNCEDNQYQIVCKNINGEIENSNVVAFENKENTNKINLFPNPTSNELNIENYQTNCNYSIIDVFVRTVYTIKQLENLQTISIEFLPTGIYYFQSINAKGTKSISSIVKK